MAYNQNERSSYFRRRSPMMFARSRPRARFEDFDYDDDVVRVRQPVYRPDRGTNRRRRSRRDEGAGPAPMILRSREHSQIQPTSYYASPQLRRRASPETLDGYPAPQAEAATFPPVSESPPQERRYTDSPPPVAYEHTEIPANVRAHSDDEWEDTIPARPGSRGRNRFFTSGGPVVIEERHVVPDDRYYANSRSDSPVSDDMDAFDEFEFNVVSPGAKDVDLSDLESPTPDNEGPQALDNGNPITSQASAVFTSHYTGNAEQGGEHHATLTVLPNTKGQKRSLFRWLHIQKDVMNFDAFWLDLSRQVRLSEVERKAITKLRAEVKRLCIKSRTNPKGYKVGYMEPRYLQVPLRRNDEEKSEGALSSFARWICLPYFSLQQYSGLLSASSTASFPAQTLLQSEYSRTDQQRDMEQAVCQLGIAPRGACFHISQLWCLVLDNTLLVTCSSMSQTELRGEALKLSPEPTRSLAGPPGPGRILVSYSKAVEWSIMTDECPTWFAFLSFFTVFWPQNLEFKLGEQVVGAQNWPKILKLALNPRARVTLTVKTLPKPDAPQRGILQLEQADDGKLKAPLGSPPPPPENMHVFTLLRCNGTGASSAPDSPLQALRVQLESVEMFLSEKLPYASKKAFKTCKQATRAEVFAQLTAAAVEVEARENDEIRRSYEDRVDIANASDILFQLFLPAKFDGPTVHRFWGAIADISQVPEISNDTTTIVNLRALGQLRSFLRGISQDIMAFQSIMSYSDDKTPGKIDMPRQFVTAWLHILSSLICIHVTSGDWYGHMEKAKSLISDGMDKLIRSIPNKNLLEKAEVLPLELVSLMSLGLLQDQVGKGDDIGETYSDLLSSLDTDIRTKPSDRSYQRRIDLVQQEMDAVRKTVMRQRHIISSISNNSSSPDGADFRRTDDGHSSRRRPREYVAPYDAIAPPAYDAGPYAGPYYDIPTRRAYDDTRLGDEIITEIESGSELSPTDPSGFRRLFLADCLRIIEQREYDFRRYKEYAEDLERTVTFKMSWVKDRQENAIYAFTIVTVIFLPLSSIAGIFGMNTSDVRDMDFTQWLYWATAVPVTIFIIVLGLWWMNELGNFSNWILGKRAGRSNVGYTGIVSEEQPGPYVPTEVPITKTNEVYRPTLMAATQTARPTNPRTYDAAPAVLQSRHRRRGQPVVRY